MQSAITVFAQFLSLVPKSRFIELSQQHNPERSPRTFSPWSHFVRLLHAQLAGCKSLRDGIMSMNAASTVTEARCHEVNIAKLLKLPKGSIVVFDRGYIDYTWFRQLCKSDVYLVTRLKNNARSGMAGPDPA